MNNQQEQIKETAFCKTHPTCYIGKDQWGNWYATCVQGNREGKAGRIPSCEIIVERGEQYVK